VLERRQDIPAGVDGVGGILTSLVAATPGVDGVGGILTSLVAATPGDKDPCR
jgi:hypothetical protein